MNETSTVSNQNDSTGSTGDLKAGKDAVTEAYEKLMEAKAHFRHAAEAAGLDLKDEAMEKVKKGREDIEALGSQVASSTRENPPFWSASFSPNCCRATDAVRHGYNRSG